MSKKKKSKATIPQEGTIIRFLAGIMKEVGLTGFIVLMIASIFFIWGTPEQKREFIDSFILLKHVNQSPFSCVLVVVALIFLMIVGTIYYNKILKLRKDENNRIGEEKSKLQELLLQRKLESSE